MCSFRRRTFLGRGAGGQKQSKWTLSSKKAFRSFFGKRSGGVPPHCRKTRRGDPLAQWPRRASPGSWWTMEKAFCTVSLRLEAKTELLGSVDHKFGVIVDE